MYSFYSPIVVTDKTKIAQHTALRNIIFNYFFTDTKTRLSGFLKFTTNHNHNITDTLKRSHLVKWQLAAIVFLFGA
jgi:hypothetical protein